MKQILKFLSLILKLVVFLALVAFAIKNKDNVTLNLFFGYSWHLPLVFVILGSLIIGFLCGVLSMLPSWWRKGREVKRVTSLSDSAPLANPTPLSHPTTYTSPDDHAV